MEKKGVPARPALEGGYYWYRNWISLRGGGHVDEWKLARIVSGKVQRFGSEALIGQNCEYLRHALWIRIEPPDADAVRLANEGRQPGREGESMNEGGCRAGFERVWAAAEEIVDALLSTSPNTVASYRDRPAMKAELTAEVVRIIRSLGA